MLRCPMPTALLAAGSHDACVAVPALCQAGDCSRRVRWGWRGCQAEAGVPTGTGTAPSDCLLTARDEGAVTGVSDGRHLVQVPILGVTLWLRGSTRLCMALPGCPPPRSPQKYLLPEQRAHVLTPLHGSLGRRGPHRQWRGRGREALAGQERSGITRGTEPGEKQGRGRGGPALAARGQRCWSRSASPAGPRAGWAARAARGQGCKLFLWALRPRDGSSFAFSALFPRVMLSSPGRTHATAPRAWGRTRAGPARQLCQGRAGLAAAFGCTDTVGAGTSMYF